MQNETAGAERRQSVQKPAEAEAEKQSRVVKLREPESAEKHSQTSITFKDTPGANHPYLRVRSYRAAKATNAESPTDYENAASSALKHSLNAAESATQLEKQVSLDSHTIDIIVAKLLAAAGKRPSILRHVLNDSSKLTIATVAVAKNHQYSKRVSAVQQSPMTSYRCPSRLASPQGASRRARSCAPRRDANPDERFLKRNSLSHKLLLPSGTHSYATDRPFDTPTHTPTPRSRRKTRVRKRKQKLSFLQQSPGSER